MYKYILLVFLVTFGIGMTADLLTNPTKLSVEPECFGQVEVRAYTAHDPGNKYDDGRTATNKVIQRSDYSVAVSPDVEAWLGGISNQRVIHVPGYCDAGGFALVNDRSDIALASVEVLLTAPKGGKSARQRAMAWGCRKGTLYKMQTPAGLACWVVFEEE